MVSYFTYNTIEGIGALYNGRFAFIKNENLPLLRELESTIMNRDNELIFHEYFHATVFRKSKIGRDINSSRFSARKGFLKGDYDIVVKYYLQRQIYFILSYSTHEEIVNQLLEDMNGRSIEDFNKISLKPKLIAKIRRVDSNYDMIKGKLNMPLIDNSFVSKTMGYISSRKPSFQFYDKNSTGEIRLDEIAISSYFFDFINAAFSKTSSRKNVIIRLLKKIRRSLNREKILLKSNQRAWLELIINWTILKFGTERLVSTNKYIQSFIDENNKFNRNRLHELFEFIFDHTMIKKDPVTIYILVSLLTESNVIVLKKEDSLNRWEIDKIQLDLICKKILMIVEDELLTIEEVERIFNFFYTHGN